MSEPVCHILDPDKGLPLVVRPGRSAGLRHAGAAAAWAAEHRSWVEERLRAHGALLFRDLPVREAPEFEAVARNLCAGFQDYTRGNSPRHPVSGQVYSSTDLSRSLVIPLHNELSYSANYPSRLFLFCHTPATRRGQTPVADGRRVWKRLEPEVRNRLAQRGVSYIQNLPRRPGLRPQCWPRMFGTDREDEVERICEGLGIRTEWTGGGGLQLTNTRPAGTRHPDTGEQVWFNQSNVFHRVWSTEVWRAGRPVLAGLLRLGEVLAAGKPAESRPSHALYGDGSELGEDIESIRQVLWDESVLVEWRTGDLLMLDNLLAVHGRMPFRGPRRILALLGGGAGPPRVPD